MVRSIFNLNTLICTIVIVAMASVIQYASHNGNNLEITLGDPFISEEIGRSYVYFPISVENKGVGRAKYVRGAGDKFQLKLNNGRFIKPRNLIEDRVLELDSHQRLADSVNFDYAEFGDCEVFQLQAEIQGKIYTKQFTKFQIR